MTFNDEVLNDLRASVHIETVVLASTFRAFTLDLPWRALARSEEAKLLGRSIEEDFSISILSDTIDALRSLGKKVVIVAPPPASGIDHSACIERQLTGKLTFGVASCDIDQVSDRQYYKRERRLLKRLAREADVEIVDFSKWLCDARGKCVTLTDGVPIYRDAIHLSVVGSEHIGRKHDLANTLIDAAR